MRGYHNNPEATAEVLTEDGWFRTGDIGRIDERGFLYVTDRKKDFFKTSGGKYIAPAEIEARFKGMCPFVSQFLVHGAGHNYATALVTLDPDAMAGWAATVGLAGKSYAEIVTSPQARALVQGYVDKLNDGLNRWETIKKFTILDQDLTVEDGRPHAEHEAAPQGRDREAPRRARRDVRRRLTAPGAQRRAGRSRTIPASACAGSGKTTWWP